VTGLFGAPEMADWTGQSLGFIRRVTGQDAKYPSAAEAAEASTFEEGPPQIGGFCWYDTPLGNGNVSLSLGGNLCLCVGRVGTPDVIGYRSPGLGTYVGWSKQIGATDERQQDVHGQ